MKCRLAAVFTILLSAVIAPAAVVGAKPVSLLTSRANPLPLSARVIQKGELPGFGPYGAGGPTHRYKSAKQWVAFDSTLTPTQASAEIARLQREGYKAALSEQLALLAPDRGGVSWVLQVGSAAAARAELAATVHDLQRANQPPISSYTAFPVSTIPGAHGYHQGGTDNFDGVVFADGPFVYQVGDGWTKTNTHPPPRSQLIAAATRLYKRVHGHPAP